MTNDEILIADLLRSYPHADVRRVVSGTHNLIVTLRDKRHAITSPIAFVTFAYMRAERVWVESSYSAKEVL